MSSASTLTASFVRDLNLPDGTEVAVGPVTKQWELRNSGTAAWPHDTTIAFQRGEMLGAASSFHVAPLAPGGVTTVSIELVAKAPEGHPTPGGGGRQCRSYWKLKHGGAGEGRVFGDTLWCDLMVVQ